jgi:signal transduction histidine kinase
MILHDGEAGQFVVYTEEFRLTQPGLRVRRGDLVEIEGHTDRGGFAPNVIPERARRLGEGRLPEPRQLRSAAMRTGRYDCEYVEVEGVGQRAWLAAPVPHTLFLEVAVDGNPVRATFWDFHESDLERFVDARIRLRGSVGALFGEAGQLRGVALLVGRTDEVSIDEPPPEPFSLPVRSVSSLYAYSAHGEVDRRVKVRGVVAHQRLALPVEIPDLPANTLFTDVQHLVFLRDQTGALRVETVQDELLAPGDVVEVAGFPTLTPTKPALRNAVLRKVAVEPPPEPTPLAVSAVPSREQDAELVEVEARLLGQIARPAERALVLQAGEVAFEGVVAASSKADSLERLRNGSLLAVSGVYAFQPGPPPSFRLLLRSPEDIEVLAAAPWWTRRHSLVLAVIVGLLGSAALLWVRAITTRNRLAQERYRAVIAERSRLARELHDTLEQGLAGITLQLEAVSGSMDASPEAARRSLGVAREMLRYSLDEARRSVMDLRSQSLEHEGLAGALSDLASRMTRGTPLVAQVMIEGDPRELDASEEHHLFRIGVEALTNTIKYAEASRVEIGLRFGTQVTELSVRDDGRGFQAREVIVPGEHFGLRGIRERVDKLGGELHLESIPGSGTSLIVRLPARPNAASAS